MAWSHLVDMELDDEAIADQDSPLVAPEQPKYPWGLCIRLTEKELEKLGLDDDCEIGDMIDMRCFAEVTSVRKEAGQDGSSCCVELQIIRMAVENEMVEDMDE